MTGGLGQTTSVLRLGRVQDGVMCGENRICINQTCKDIPSMISLTRCPQNVPPHGNRAMAECSGNGVRFNLKDSYVKKKICLSINDVAQRLLQFTRDCSFSFGIIKFYLLEMLQYQHLRV